MGIGTGMWLVDICRWLLIRSGLVILPTYIFSLDKQGD